MASETVPVCPDCDRASLRRCNPANPQSTADGQYRCTLCGRHFDDPPVRERKHGSYPRGLAGELLAADPEEVSR